jgi:hypothetical protein
LPASGQQVHGFQSKAGQALQMALYFREAYYLNCNFCFRSPSCTAFWQGTVNAGKIGEYISR